MKALLTLASALFIGQQALAMPPSYSCKDDKGITYANYMQFSVDKDENGDFIETIGGGFNNNNLLPGGFTFEVPFGGGEILLQTKSGDKTVILIRSRPGKLIVLNEKAQMLFDLTCE